MTYTQYIVRAQERLTQSTPETDTHFEHRKLNLQRMRRIEQTFKPSQEIISAMASITEAQTWSIITEDWCGDSSQTLTAMCLIGSLNPLVTVEIFDRDENPELMEQYLTNGAKAIPKLVVRNAGGQDLWVWGPRPAPAHNPLLAPKKRRNTLQRGATGGSRMVCSRQLGNITN